MFPKKTWRYAKHHAQNFSISSNNIHDLKRKLLRVLQTFPLPPSLPFLLSAGKTYKEKLTKNERLTDVQSTVVLDQILKMEARKAGSLWPLLRLQNSYLVEVLHQRDFL